MSGDPSSLSALRQLLTERFPQATRLGGGVLPTGIPSVDEQTGGLPRQALTELVCSAPSCGSQLFLGQLLHLTRLNGSRVALIDGSDSFDPNSWSAEDLEHLVWVRCRAITDALPVADLFARDANLELIILDLRWASKNELRRTPAATWYRLQRAVEQTDLALLAVTPLPVVPSAHLRLMLGHSHTLSDLCEKRPDLTATLPATLHRQRLVTRLEMTRKSA